QIAEDTHELAPRIEIDDLMESFEGMDGGSLIDGLRAVGKQAVSADTVSEEVRRAVIAHRLPSHDWPDRRLEITAIDVVTGERVLFDRHSGVSLVDAVAASCAVPVVWPPVTVGTRRFMDGGIGSRANVDAATDVDAVVMLSPAPAPGLSPFGGSLVDELDEHPGRTMGVYADDASVAAF